MKYWISFAVIKLLLSTVLHEGCIKHFRSLTLITALIPRKLLPPISPLSLLLDHT